jgi:hypothetical protein
MLANQLEQRSVGCHRTRVKKNVGELPHIVTTTPLGAVRDNRKKLARPTATVNHRPAAAGAGSMPR